MAGELAGEKQTTKFVIAVAAVTFQRLRNDSVHQRDSEPTALPCILMRLLSHFNANINIKPHQEFGKFRKKFQNVLKTF